jgi:DNA-directed RNA polymerase specialized sigma24 family protein
LSEPAVSASGPESDEEILRSVLPAARRIARFGFRVPPQDVEDVLQQASIDFLLHSRRGARATSGLMIVITRRRCLDYWRGHYRSGIKEVALDELREGDAAYPVECAPAAQQTLDGWRLARTWSSLPATCRELLARRFWKQEKTADLARMQGRRPDSVKRFISRCLGRLRRGLEGAGGIG